MDYRILTPDSADYPLRLKERLAAEAPSLYARGRLDFLSRWTMAFFTADVEPGLVTRAVWDMFFPILKMEMNAIGPWQSVNEGVFFRSALEKPWISLTLFTARGIEQESFSSFLEYRHRPPNATFIQRPEYERRAADNELLLLSVSPPQHQAQSKEVIMHRNWIACNLADVVFIGGAEKTSQQWSAKAGKLTPRRQKTFALARRLVKSGIPVFTVDHPDNKDLLDLGVPGYRPDAISDLFIHWGTQKGKIPDSKPEYPAVQSATDCYTPAWPISKSEVVQQSLFEEPPRKGSETS